MAWERKIPGLFFVALALFAGESGQIATETCQSVDFGGWYGIGREWQTVMDDWAPDNERAWGRRGGFGFAVLGGRLLVFGGETRTEKKNDVFMSSNGESWLELASTSRWGPRTNFPHVLHTVGGIEYLYVLSGRGCDGCGANTCYCNDVWRAPTPATGSHFEVEFAYVGKTATQMGRERGLALSFEGRLYDIGGRDTSSQFLDIHVLIDNDTGKVEVTEQAWVKVEVTEPTCTDEDGICAWTLANVAYWPGGHDEYRIVGTTYMDAIYLFGGKVSTSVLQLKLDGTGGSAGAPTRLRLEGLGSVVPSGGVYRGFAFTFLSTLWFATGLEDSGNGNSGLFYMADGKWYQQDELNFFDGRLHGGVASSSFVGATPVQNRICLFLGSDQGTYARWKLSCSVRPYFPEARLFYTSENVGTEDAVVLRDHATYTFQHATVPPGVNYNVISYAGQYEPDTASRNFPRYYNNNVKVSLPEEDCVYNFKYQKVRIHPNALFIWVRMDFQTNQAYLSTKKDVTWTIKETHSAPTASSAFIKETKTQTQTGTENVVRSYHITISCNSAECEGAFAPTRCRVTFRYAAGALRIPCEAHRCDVNIEDLVHRDTWSAESNWQPKLFDVMARCENQLDEWIASDEVTFAAPDIFWSTPAPAPTPDTTPSPHSQLSAPITPTPRPSRSASVSGILCCGEAYNNCQERVCSGSTTTPTPLKLDGQNLDLLIAVHIGAHTCKPDLTKNAIQTTSYFCSVPAGLGTEDLKLISKSTSGSTGDSITYSNAIRYPTPRIASITSDALPTGGGGAVTLVGSQLGGGVFGGFSTNLAPPWISLESATIQASAKIGGTLAAGVIWHSDTTLTIQSPRGVGIGHRLSFSIRGKQVEHPDTFFDYQAPQLTAVKPSFGPDGGGIKVTFLGHSFGHELYPKVRARLHASDCIASTWVSDSSLICTTPIRTDGSMSVAVPSNVLVGGQNGLRQNAFQYTSATDQVEVLLSESPEELETPLAKGLNHMENTGTYGNANTRLGGFTLWLRAVLALTEVSQVYVDSVRPCMLTSTSGASCNIRRAGDRKTKVLLLFLQSPQHEQPLDTVLLNLETLSQGKQAAQSFAQSGVTIESIRIKPGAKMIQIGPSITSGNKSLGTHGQAEQTASDIRIFVGVAIGVVVLGAAASFIIFRKFLASRPAAQDLQSAGVEITSSPRPIDAQFASNGVSSNARLSVRADSVFASVPSPKSYARKTAYGMCTQCYNSGFATCIHQEMGLARQVEKDPEESEAEEDEMCVVCLDAPREALVVHDDTAKTSHRVLCLACAYRILEQGGSCPMCRQTIFAVFKAGDKAGDNGTGDPEEKFELHM